MRIRCSVHGKPIRGRVYHWAGRPMCLRGYRHFCKNVRLVRKHGKPKEKSAMDPILVVRLNVLESLGPRWTGSAFGYPTAPFSTVYRECSYGMLDAPCALNGGPLVNY